jgi:phosphoglycerol transferase MdoB-like AlkP superfamily enzyme
MKNRFVFLGKLALFLIVYFVVARLFFHLYSWEFTKEMGWSDFFLSYVYGLRLDASITGYLMMLFALLMPLSLVISSKGFRWMVDVLIGFFIVLFSLIIWADAALYTHWGFRIDTTPLMYLTTPKDAMASLPLWQLGLFLVAWLLYSSLFIVVFRRWVSSIILSLEHSHWMATFAFLLFSGCMILPVRGSVGIAPVNTGMVYFSSNLYTNHSTVNAVWNFMYDLSHRDRTNLTVSFMESDKAIAIRDAFVSRPDSVPSVIDPIRPNVLMIILEGVAAQVIEPLGGRKGVTPNINQLWNEGIAFNHIYASGSRSDRGLVAILSGYPSHPLASLMKYPKKTQKVNSITRVLSDEGYSTAFYYGGDTDFANMNSYLKNSGFQRVVNQNDFPDEFRNSKWGVHDQYLFERVMTDVDSAKGSFFKAFFTLSSHEPFDVPMSTVIQGKGDNEKYMNSVFYTDSCLGHFIRQAKTKKWWNNTLIIIVSDHNVRYVEDYRIDEPRRYAIPMIWTGGVVKQSGKVDVYGSQCDIAVTLLKQMDLPINGFPFSSNLFSTTGGGVMYHFNKGFGFVTPEGNVIYDLNNNQMTEHNGDSLLIDQSKGLFQSMIDDFNGL